MQPYTTIIGVIEFRLSGQSYDVIQKRYSIGSSTVTLIMKRYRELGIPLETLYGMSEEDFRAFPTDGEASLLNIMQQFDLFNTDEDEDEDDEEEPASCELEDNPLYERVDRVLTETCSVEALEEYRAFCEAHNMKWRIPSILKMIFDKVSGTRQ